ncbi:antitoxin Xre/MbcA/ParS toxin-binding domain-containing protein [Pseudomonas sp. MH10]|nr:antitoxin Xre/MbcA/ParS toxin-binding domain-containing protein [Pseudomonas sp. MH10]MEB0042988.1 DUF2384 domain-containing protein [Pseudomonas sp. MH10]WPX63569.1 DUF2384 domain-containing protein [Pseudomonas sp. MH10]
MGDRAPLEVAREEEGYLLVKDQLERIRHGFSF